MSRLFTNLYNNIESFEDTDSKNTESEQAGEQQTGSQNTDSENTGSQNTSSENTGSQNTGSENTDLQNASSENADSENTDSEKNDSGVEGPPIRRDAQSLSSVRKEDINDSTIDETDDMPDADDPDPVKNEMDDLFEDDEQDEEVLTEAEIDDLIDGIGNEGGVEEADESDEEVYVPPKIVDDPTKYNSENDGKLTDMTIDDDDADDNLLKQGGAVGERTLEMISQMSNEGDELADLILEVPITFIQMMVETILKIIGAVFEGPITAVDSFLEPIRDALKGLWSILRPIVVLINYVIALPISIGIFAWSTLCNVMKVLGIGNAKCNRDYTPNEELITFFDLISNINPFRFRDIFFSDDFRNSLFEAIRMLFMKIKDAFILIVKIINIVTKIIEFLIVKMTEIIKITEEVTQKNNLQGFFVIVIMLGIIYLTLFGLKHAIDLIETIRDKFFS